MLALEKIWTENELVEKLGLPIIAKNKSRVISSWVKDGLNCIEKSGKRYFVDEEILEYLMKFKKS